MVDLGTWEPSCVNMSGSKAEPRMIKIVSNVSYCLRGL